MASRPFSVEVQVRFRDLDAMRHVNNAVYFSYMEFARTQYYMATMHLDDLEDIEFILAAASCDFKAPIQWGEAVVVSVWLTRIGRSSFELAYELRSKTHRTLFATGTSVQVAYDYAAGKSKEIPTRLRHALEAGMKRGSMSGRRAGSRRK